MADDRTLIMISALADGELAAEAARKLEATLNSDAALRRELSIYRKLDAAAAGIPVPQIDQRLDSGLMRDAVTPHSGKLEQAAAELSAPKISSERFAQVWKKIAARTVAPPAAELDAMHLSALHDGEWNAADRATVQAQVNASDAAAWYRLDAAARELPVPELDELTAREAWHNIAEQTVNLSAQDRRDFEKLEAAASRLPVPSVDTKLDQLWEIIAERAYAPDAALTSSSRALQNEPVPAVSGEKWNSVWQNIQKQTQPAKPAAKSATATSAKVVPVSFQPKTGRKRWAFALSAAALLAVSALLFVFTQNGEQQTAMELPEVLDERYSRQIKYLEGQSEPVVCFFLKEDSGIDENNLQSFQWLPD
jgi:hypothetical protein